MELFEEIRREHEFGIGTIKGVARKLRVHRWMVRQALANARPPERRRSERARSVVGPLIPFINAILEADLNAPRKQSHRLPHFGTQHNVCASYQGFAV